MAAMRSYAAPIWPLIIIGLALVAGGVLFLLRMPTNKTGPGFIVLGGALILIGYLNLRASKNT